MVFEKPGDDELATAKPIMHTLHAAHQNRRQAEKMWTVAGDAPLIRKRGKDKVVQTRTSTKLVPTYRKNGALSAHTIKTLASGGAAYATGVIYREAGELRNDTVPESTKYPLLPSVGQSAARMLDQAAIAFAQHVLHGAVRLKSAKKPTPEKVAFKCAKASLDATMMHLCQANSTLPPGTMVRPLPKTKAKQPTQKKSAKA